jgi:hypothetical protein
MIDHTPRPGGRVIARTVLADGGLPLAAAGVAAGLMLLWRDELPSLVATHWGWSGFPDEFGSDATVVWLVLGFAAGLATLGLIFAVATRFEPVVGRVVAATVAGLAGFVATLAVGVTWLQRGLDDAADFAPPVWPIPVASAVALAWRWRAGF